jgi:hypothetical protein
VVYTTRRILWYTPDIDKFTSTRSKIGTVTDASGEYTTKWHDRYMYGFTNTTQAPVTLDENFTSAKNAKTYQLLKG